MTEKAPNLHGIAAQVAEAKDESVLPLLQTSLRKSKLLSRLIFKGSLSIFEIV